MLSELDSVCVTQQRTSFVWCFFVELNLSRPQTLNPRHRVLGYRRGRNSAKVDLGAIRELTDSPRALLYLP